MRSASPAPNVDPPRAGEAKPVPLPVPVPLHHAVSALLALAAVPLFWWLRQRRLHGFDSEIFLKWTSGGTTANYPQHPLFLPAMGWLYRALHPLGLDAYQVLTLASATGSAIAVWCLCRAAPRLLPADRSPLLLPLGVAATPPFLFYATAVEIHGVFAAAAAAVWLAFARWRARPGRRRALLLGVACGAAGGVHSFGHLLAPTVVLTAIALGDARRQAATARPWPDLAALLLGHAGVALAIVAVADRGGPDQATAAWSFLRGWLGGLSLAPAGTVIAHEWWLAFAPWSLTALAALLVARSRRWAIAALLGVAVHLPLTVVLLARGPGLREQGAYLLPLAVPFVAATAALLPRRATWWVVAASAIVAVLQLWPRWQPPCPPEFAAGVQQLRAERPFVLVVGRVEELEAVLTAMDGQPVLSMQQYVLEYLALPSPPPLDRWFDEALDRLGADGALVLFTASVPELLRDSGRTELAALWDVHVAARYRIEPVQAQGLSALRLAPR